MLVESLQIRLFNETQLRNHGSFSNHYPKFRASANIRSRAFRAPQEPLDDEKNKLYKELGMYSLRRRIEDSVLRAEMLGPTSLEFEEAKHTNQEELIRQYDLWDDLSKSSEILKKMADTARAVDSLRDLPYKAEEAKLITELVGMDGINDPLFNAAYDASLDVNNILNKYEMSKLLMEPYDMEGACITLESRPGDTYSQRWTRRLAQMYMKWAERLGHAGRIIEKRPSTHGGVNSIIIELEFKFAYGYLSGETGVHSMISCQNTCTQPEASFALVDVIPIFIESSPDLPIDDEDILVSYYPSSCKEDLGTTSLAVQIKHVPTGLQVQSTGERTRFANKMKALNRLKAKLVILLRDQRISNGKSIEKGDKMDRWSQETRKYILCPSEMVHDLKSEIQVPDVNGVLNGNLDPLIAAHINSRQKLV